MSDQTSTDTAADQEQPQEAQQAAQDDAQPQEDQDHQDGNPNAEAKKYRLRLRETEAELEAAQQRVSQLQRTLAEAALEEHLSSPSDLWDIGSHDAAAFYTETGDLDRDRLTDAARELVTARPGLQAARGAYVPKIADAPKVQASNPFADAFKPVRQR